MNDNRTIDAASTCARYRESATPEMLIRFERELIERFGPTPDRAVAEEAVKIWKRIFIDG